MTEELNCPECDMPLSVCKYPHPHRLPRGANVRIGHAGHVFGETTEEFYRRMAMEEFAAKVRDREVSKCIAKNTAY